MINKFTDLLKQLKEPKSSILYQSYVDILNQYDFNERDVVHQQWIEAWLETSPAKSIEKTNQGVYLSYTIRDKMLERFGSILIEALNLKSISSLPPANNQIEKITESEVQSWLELDSYWVLTLLTTIHCNIKGIESSYIDAYLNGRFSIYADSFNERLKITNKAIRYIESGELTASDFDDIFSFFGAFFILSFCDDEMLKQRTINAASD